MQMFPVFTKLIDQKVVIVGGGEDAARKARLLRAAHAHVYFIYPVIEESVRLEFAKNAKFIDREPLATDFERTKIAFVAVEDAEQQKLYAELIRRAGVLVNVVDVPALCDFNTPSIIDRDEVVVAISTNGKAPMLGRSIRSRIEKWLPARLGSLVTFAGRYRPAVKVRFPGRIRQFWGDFFDGAIATQFLAGDEHGAHDAMMKHINQFDGDDLNKDQSPMGVVQIVGAGPGDPELLTMRAHRLLQEADVILYDRLVSEDILSLARRDAVRHFVGKEKSNHAVPQEEIHDWMIALARTGKNVVRLKGGDPFIFGRGGEELSALQEAGVPAFVTPGITAAAGCAAAMGMALTHRDHAQVLTFVTGHTCNEEDPTIDWQSLAQSNTTLVVYMGINKSSTIAEKLIAFGRSKSTPVAVIENGTRNHQVLAKGNLGTLPLIIERAGIKSPALLVIGEVAQLAKETFTDEIQQNLNDMQITQQAQRMIG